MSFLVIVNPTAGFGRAGRQAPLIQHLLERLGESFVLMRTQAPRHATEVTRRHLDRNPGAGVVVVGGDGTLNEVVNGFFDADGKPISETSWVALIPAGTGNDFARTLGIPAETEAAVHFMAAAAPRAIDVGWLHYVDEAGHEVKQAFVNVASFGLSGEADRIVKRSKKRLGGAVHSLGAFKAMRRYRPQPVHLIIDESEELEASMWCTAVANGKFFGAGIPIAPEAACDDAALELVLLENRSWGELMRLPVALYRGKHIGKPGVHRYRIKSLLAQPAAPSDKIALDIDGDSPGYLPARFELIPAGVRFRG